MDRRGFLELTILPLLLPPTVIAAAELTRVVLTVDGMT